MPTELAETGLPAALVDLQRAATHAWDAVEEHRKRVDAARREEAVAAGARVDETRPWASLRLRDWTPEEDGEHERLIAAARAAAEARRRGLAESGLGGGYDVVQALHLAARAATV